MKSENTPTIRTQRLILRKFKPEDAGDLFALLRDEEANTFLPWFPIKTLGEAQKFLKERFLDYYEKPAAYRYAICLGDDRPIGYVLMDNAESYNFGYGLKTEYWHRGIVTEASKAVVEKIARAGYPYITATHDKNNPRSGEVMKKLGMTYRYSYVEQWQPKDISVTFRMYQRNFRAGDECTYMEYWDKYPEHFVEQTA